MELISGEMGNQLPHIRINAIQKVRVLWKNRYGKIYLLIQRIINIESRYQVWSRLEENGQINMKVTPSQIEFTLPSPKIGIENLPVVDPPWMPKLKTKVENLDIRRRGQVC